MKNRFTKNKKLKITLVVILVLSMLISIPLYIINNKLSKINIQEITETPQQLLIDEEKFKNPEKSEEDFVNILLLGIDSRDVSKDPGRSDSMIIATVDKKHKKLKLTSLMRDTLVEMEGKGPMKGQNQDRLNHAYAYGGPLLTMKTINHNFDMNIKDYVKVDFWGLEKIIDSIGGVNINVKESEIPYVNSYMEETSSIKKENYSTVKKAGLQKLNGRQAVAYSRIRYIGTDYERTERQRKVLSEVFAAVSQKSTLDLYKIIDTALPYMETSLEKKAIIDLASVVAVDKVTTVQQYRVPEDKLGFSTTVNGVPYFIDWKKDETIKNLHNFIFETQE
jgi:polyisoprenyl-teichoic acid--peptidoglycan teichoic acid transferase